MSSTSTAPGSPSSPQGPPATTPHQGRVSRQERRRRRKEDEKQKSGERGIREKASSQDNIWQGAWLIVPWLTHYDQSYCSGKSCRCLSVYFYTNSSLRLFFAVHNRHTLFSMNYKQWEEPDNWQLCNRGGPKHVE